MKKLKSALKKTVNALKKMTPVIIGVILAISIATTIIPNSYYSKLMNGTYLDLLTGTILGSVAAGNPITSYIIGGEALTNGASLLGVLAFIISWVTVGMIQFPAEAALLGKKFAISRNIISFIFAMIISIITVLII